MYKQSLTIFFVVLFTQILMAAKNYKEVKFAGTNFTSFTLPNKLEVLVVSDKRFIKSSAAIAVRTGSQDEPQNQPGIAHFLEHMLFLGTKDSPITGEYEDFLTKNGGYNNAYTATDHTNYFFEVDHGGLEQGLKRLSRFFVNPLFDNKYLTREQNAVDSEHRNNIENDNAREYRFVQTFLNPKHPYSQFNTGNLDTLKNINRDKIIQFFEQNYSSNKMKLVIMSNNTTDKLAELATKYFSDIPDRNLTSKPVGDALFEGQKLPQFHKVKTIKDQDILLLTFAIPDDIPHWKTKPLHLLANLINQQTDGSISEFLKNQGWAFSISSGGGERLFQVRIELTPEGKLKQYDIIASVLSYISLLKNNGVKTYLFEEYKKLAKLELDNFEPTSDAGKAASYSSSMLYHPADDFIERFYLYHDYQADVFESFIKQLNPSNMHVTFFSKNINGEKTERFYNIKYTNYVPTAKELKKLQSPIDVNNFKYPAPNVYIPNNLKMVKNDYLAKPFKKISPLNSSIYHQLDTELGIPKSSLTITIASDKVENDPKKFLMVDLFSQLKEEELTTWGYNPKAAGLSYAITFNGSSINVSLDGYSQHMLKLAEDLIRNPEQNQLFKVARVSQEKFDKLKSLYKKNLNNNKFNSAMEVANYEFNYLTNKKFFHHRDLLKVVDTIKLNEINEFMSVYFKEIYVFLFAYGNIEPKNFDPLIEYIYQSLGAKKLSLTSVEKWDASYLKLNQNLLVKSSGENNNNALITNYKLDDWTLDCVAITAILAKAISQPYFNELRTNQQLGYMVSAYNILDYGYCGMGASIQSEAHKSEKLLIQSDEFFKKYLQAAANNIDQKSFDDIKQSLILEITKMPNSFSERANRFFILAGSKYGDYDYYVKLKNKIESINLEGFHKWLILKFQSQDMVRITSLYQGKNKKIPLIKGYHDVKNIDKFKQGSNFHNPYKEPIK